MFENLSERLGRTIKNLRGQGRLSEDNVKDTLREVTEMRTRVQAVPEGDIAGRAVAEGLLSQALGKLMAVAEAYPDLKANENFLQLQQTLDKIEGEVQMSRRYYNGAARDLNVKVESFPSNFVANFFNFQTAEFFEVENAGDRQVPEVKF